MRLKTLLTLGILASIAFVAFLGYGLVLVSTKHSQLIQQAMITDNFNSGIQELGILAGDYRLFHNERSRIQWLNRYHSLQTIIAQQKPYLSKRKMDLLLRDFSKSHTLFQQLLAIHNGRIATEFKSIISFQEQALNEQLQTTIQIMSSTARQMITVIHEQLDDIISQIKRLIIALLFLIITMLTIFWLTIAARILAPIKALCSEIELFSDNMMYRLNIKRKDEIGEMAQAFNTMADQLQEVTVSREKMTHQAHHDALTGLPNRLLFMDRLNQAIKQADRNGTKIAVVFIDLDRFKEINDSLGHKVGDDVLIHVSQRLQMCMRDTDTVSRLGGDEFMMIIGSIRDSNIIAEIVKKIMHKLFQPIPVLEHNLYITLSLGISIYPDDANNSESLIRNADTAMYSAKEEGRNTYRYYSEDMTNKAFEHILIESGLRHALEHNELSLVYQPQVNINNLDIIGVEALVRWQHKKLGLIPPVKFIPLAEDTGLIVTLGEQVLDMACKQVIQWVKLHKKSFRVAVKFSFKQLQQADIVQRISQILKENQCLPEWIELEVTEGYIMKNPLQAIATLQQIRALGITISIDDFGTGYSSLSYLKKLPVNKLKIDQGFIRGVTDNEDDQAIIVAIISLAHSMNLKVIAEGVETSAQSDYLQNKGCEYVQGYLYGKPMDSEKMTRLLVDGLKNGK
ncbi:MAG: EAL domain-containing protein [Gammaproteobacteria bacterium]|nr:EAL domain-containing protein [Gammaproteobacteria bacterium]